MADHRARNINIYIPGTDFGRSTFVLSPTLHKGCITI